MNKIKRVGDSLVKELSAMMDEMTVSVESCLESIPSRDAESGSGEGGRECPGEGKYERGICQGVKSRFSFLVDELQEAFHPEQQPEMTNSDISWLSGILRECKEKPAEEAAFQKNGEIRQVQPGAAQNMQSAEEIYGQKKRSWRFFPLDKTPAAENFPEAGAAAGETSAERTAPLSRQEKKKAAKKRSHRQVETAKKEKSGKKHANRLVRTMTAGVMAGVCLILGMVGTEGYFQRHFVSVLESTFQGKVRYSAMDSSLSRMTVAMENTEMTFGAAENDLAEGKTRPGIQVEKAVFRLDPYALVKGRVVVQDALMEGMQFSSPETYLNDNAGENAAAPSWSLTPLLSHRCDAEIEQQLASLGSVKYFQDMKAHYVPRYAELARRSQEINQELAVLRQQLTSRMGEENVEGLFPAGMQQMSVTEGLSALAPHDSSIRLASYDPGTDTKKPAGAGQWTQDDENVTYLVQSITRLMHLRQESEKIYALCAGLKQEITSEMQKVQEKVAEDGNAFRPYLEAPVLDEKMLAEAFFAEDSMKKAQEMAAWLEMLQQVVAGGLQRELAQKTASVPADVNARFGSAAKKSKNSIAAITVQRAVTHGNVTLFGQKYFFSGDWKTIPAEGDNVATASEKLEAEITLTPARLAGLSSESAPGKIHLVMEESGGRLKKHIRADFPVHHIPECHWAANSLPVKATPESALVKMDLTCLDDQLHGHMELTYRDVTLASVATPAVSSLPSLAWEGRVQDWKADALEVSVSITGSRHAPQVACQAPELASLLPVYTQTLAELHDARKDHVASMFHQKLVDTEDSFHGAIQPVYEQIALKTGNITHLQDGLQSFLVRNMKQETAVPHVPLYGEEDYVPVRQEHYAVSPGPGYAVVNGKTYYTSSPQPLPGFAPETYAAAPVGDDFLLDAPVFNPQWSDISGAVGGDANEVMEAHSRAAAAPPVLPTSGNAVQVPVRKMSVQERDGVLILTDNPAETYVPTYSAPAPTSGEVFHDGDHAATPVEDAAISARKNETDTSSLFREEMNREGMVQAAKTRPGSSAPLSVDATQPPTPVYQAKVPAASSGAKRSAPLPMSAAAGNYK